MQNPERDPSRESAGSGGVPLRDQSDPSRLLRLPANPEGRIAGDGLQENFRDAARQPHLTSSKSPGHPLPSLAHTLVGLLLIVTLAKIAARTGCTVNMNFALVTAAIVK